MKMALIALLALFLVPGVALRYRYPVGQVLHYSIEQTVSTIAKNGDGPATPTASVQTRATEERRVISVQDGKAQVRERSLSGVITRTLPMPRMTEVVPDVERTYTFDTLGRCLDVQRSAPIAGQTPPPQFLDGLSIPLPEKPAAPGSVWSGQTSAVGPAGKGRIPLRYSGKVASAEKLQGRSCLRLEIALRGTFSQPATQGAAETSGTVTGSIVQWFDPQAGLDVRTHAELTILTTSHASSAGKSTETTWTTTLTSTQTLTK